eukprot:3859936-Pleurochrysis_carterae.AAC.2
MDCLDEEKTVALAMPTERRIGVENSVLNPTRWASPFTDPQLARRPSPGIVLEPYDPYARLAGIVSRACRCMDVTDFDNVVFEQQKSGQREQCVLRMAECRKSWRVISG